MRLAATDFYTYYRPSRCEHFRVYLRDHREPETNQAPTSWSCAGSVNDMSASTSPSSAELRVTSTLARVIEDRAERTGRAMADGNPVIYQPGFSATASLSGIECEIVGVPDFLLRTRRGYAIRDSKLSRRISESAHPEIVCQRTTVGCTSRPSASLLFALQVHNGAGEIVDLPYDGGARALEALAEIVAFKQAPSEPYSPVGWSKCGGCAFRPRCWPAAEERRDVALVIGVDQGTARGPAWSARG